MSTTCEVSEEQRARARSILLGHGIPYSEAQLLAVQDELAQALAQEAQRANERAEGLAKELVALRAKLAEGQAELARLRALPAPISGCQGESEFDFKRGKGMPCGNDLPCKRHPPPLPSAQPLASARNVIKFYAIPDEHDGSLAQAWLDAHPAEGPPDPAPQATPEAEGREGEEKP